jgi:hypothetical protein
MGRRPILPLGRWAPLILGVLALGLLLWGAISGSREMVVIGAVGAAGLLVAFPLAEFLLRGGPRDEER